MVGAMHDATERSRPPLPVVITWAIAAVIVNFALGSFARALRLPLFMDSIGTVAMAAFYGLIPGGFVGIITNCVFELVQGLSGRNWPFAFVSVASAATTTLMVRRGALESIRGAFWLTLALAVLNAALGALIASLFFGVVMDEPIDSIVRSFLITGRSMFNSAFLGRLFINIVDKGAAILVLMLLWNQSGRKAPASGE